ncbi:phosphoglycerate dehydrogenase [Candidatus Gracilibacteria bacterium]|nr:phosphoglycerate dehydrogenase [Candidatus Gracilibacteria bacterium]
MKTSFPKNKIKILLLEGVHQSALDTLKSGGYEEIDYFTHSMSEDELLSLVDQYHFIGVRSRTQITRNVLEKATNLLAVGCFCIGTNQVDLVAAKEQGIPVFNAPYSNTRSVAELVIAEAIMLFRGIPEKNALAHEGDWLKSAQNSYEARGKTLGIVGYGHIGSQVGILAENFGMKVIFYDIEAKLPFGNARAVDTLKELLEQSDIVTLHVPQTEQTKNMIRLKELKQMKQGSHLINASRGNVVVIDALVEVLREKHIHGAAMDVFPKEPKSKTEKFESPLQEFQNVILTPHIGGSTLEAQENIGKEVAQKLVTYCDNGTTNSAVNFMEINLPTFENQHRFLHIHQNKPGVMTKINEIFSREGLNVAGQYLQTSPEIGYVITDIDDSSGYDAQKLKKSLQELPESIKVRVLF